MNWPKSIRIGPYTYSVSFKKRVTTKDHYGEILFKPQTITIKEGLSDERTLTVLVHEILHGIDEVIGVELSENQVTYLANALVALWHDNREAFDQLLKEVDE
jgi:hypothetical protein